MCRVTLADLVLTQAQNTLLNTIDNIFNRFLDKLFPHFLLYITPPGQTHNHNNNHFLSTISLNILYWNSSTHIRFLVYTNIFKSSNNKNKYYRQTIYVTHLRHVFKYMFIWKTFSYLLTLFFFFACKKKKKYKKIKSNNNNNNKNQMIESTCFVYKNNFLGQRRRLWFYLFPHVHILLLERVFSVAGKPLVIPFMFVDTLFVY